LIVRGRKNKAVYVFIFFQKIAEELRMLSNEELKQQAYSYGWDRILSHFGVDGACLDSRNNARSHCPACGGDEHSNHFDFRNKSADETYHCYKCGGGDGFKLLYKFNGTAFGDVAKLIIGDSTEILRKPNIVAVSENKGYENNKDRAKKRERIRKAIKYSGHTPKTWGIEYLAGRGIKFKDPQRKLDFVRYGSGYYMDRFIPNANGKPTYHNCLIFPISRYESAGTQGLVRVYSDMNKVKEAIGGNDKKLPDKPMLSAKNISGCGVWFSKKNNNVLHVGEGIENTLSILQSLRTLNGVASVTSGLMGKLIIPPHITELHIWRDSGDAGREGARKLQKRYENDIDIVIHATGSDKDWNDILLEYGESAVRSEFNCARL
jgi:hypothetical protein